MAETEDLAGLSADRRADGDGQKGSARRYAVVYHGVTARGQCPAEDAAEDD